MHTPSEMNRAWILSSRPTGEPDDATFSLVEKEIPVAGERQMLLRTVYLSLDPYMRGRLDAGKSYAPPVAIGEVMVGGTVSQVVQSNIAGFAPGDWVLHQGGWQGYSLSGAEGAMKIDPQIAQPSHALGILGMPGFTAFMGLSKIGLPRKGETLVVAAATGPVGATVGQLARLWGCRVVGVAGGAEKCRYATDVLGFDSCIDHRSEDFAERLANACKDGIDIYYENVGGQVFDAVFPLLNSGARVPLCGTISGYNQTSLPEGPDKSYALMTEMIKRRITMRGFIVFDDFADDFPEFIETMQRLIKEGEIKYKEHIVDGLENAPLTLNKLLRGDIFGKAVIQVAPVAAE